MAAAKYPKAVDRRGLHKAFAFGEAPTHLTCFVTSYDGCDTKVLNDVRALDQHITVPQAEGRQAQQ